MSESTRRREVFRCTECDDFELEKRFTGGRNTTGEDEYDSIQLDACPACGADLDREVVD